MTSCPWCGRSCDGSGCSCCGWGLEEEREDDFDLKRCDECSMYYLACDNHCKKESDYATM